MLKAEENVQISSAVAAKRLKCFTGTETGYSGTALRYETVHAMEGLVTLD